MPPEQFLPPSGNAKSKEQLIRELAELRSQLAVMQKTEPGAPKDREAWFRRIYSEFPIAIELYDSKGLLIDVNSASLELFGVNDKQALLGFDLFADPNLPGELKGRLRSGKAVRYQYPFDFNKVIESALYPTSRRGMIWIDVIISPIGKPGTLGYLVQVQDITDRKNAEKALRDSEEKYRVVFEAESDALFLIDKETGSILNANNAAAEIYGYTRGQMVRMKISDMSAESEMTEQARRQPQKKISLRYHKKQDGTIFPVDITASTFVLDGREVILAAIRDNTERRQTEEKLSQSEERFRSLFENAPIGIATVTTRGRITSANPYLCKLLDYTLDELLQLTVQDITHPEDFARELKIIKELKQAKLPFVQYEKRYRKKSGKYLWTELATCSLQESQGNPSGLAMMLDITERKQFEAALLEREKEFRAIFEVASVGIVQIDPTNGRIINCNEKYCRITGYSRDELGKLTFPDLTHPDDRQEDWEIYAKAARGETSNYLNEKRYIRKNGSIIWVRINAGYIRDNEGRPIRTVGVCEDVTDRKRMELELRESEAKYRTLYENMAQGVFYQASDGTLVDVNRSALEMFGLTRDQFLGRTFYHPEWKVVTEDGAELPPEKHPSMVALRSGKTVTNAVLGAYNPRRRAVTWMNINAVPQFRPSEAGPFQVFVTLHDLTEQKRAEEEQKALQAKLANAIDMARLGPWEYDVATDTFLFDDHFYKLFRTKAEDVGGYKMTSAEYARRFLHPDDAYIVESGIRKAIETSDPRFSCQLGYRIICADGEIGHITVRCFIEKDAKGRTVKFYGVNQDITERKNLEAQLLQAQKMESVGRLAGGVAHDFNNKLSIILGNIEMAMEDLGDSSNSLHNYLAEINTAARQAGDLTRQLLAFARKQTIAPKLIDVNKVIEGMLKMLQRLIGEDIELSWSPGDALWTINMDPSQIDQILANLVVNARDAIPNTGHIMIETGNATLNDEDFTDIKDFDSGDYVMIAVSDNGAGMSPEIQEHLFEPFFTTKDMGRGTGLGLATVYGIVKQNRGFIHFYSGPGQGTTFKIYVPRYEREKGEDAREGRTGPLSSGHETLLLVEDEPAILKVVKRMLIRLGYNVLAARTAAEAMQLATEHGEKIQLLITDVIMPEINGRELVREIQTAHPGVKVLYMSGYTADVIAHHGVLEKEVDYIQKPFSTPSIAAKVREVLDRKPV